MEDKKYDISQETQETQDKSKEKETSESEQEKTTTSELDRADSIVERQKRENDRREEILKREESLAARRAIGGTTEGGNMGSKEVSPEVKKANDAAEFFKDTALGDAIKKTNE